MDFRKGVVPGIAAGIVIVVLGFVSSMLMPANTEWYMQTFPQMSMSSMIFSQLLIGLIMGIVYTVISPSIPGEGMSKGVNYGIIVFLFAGVMWPVMASSFAPLSIWLGDLIASLILYAIAGATVAKVHG